MDFQCATFGNAQLLRLFDQSRPSFGFGAARGVMMDPNCERAAALSRGCLAGAAHSSGRQSAGGGLEAESGRHSTQRRIHVGPSGPSLALSLGNQLSIDLNLHAAVGRDFAGPSQPASSHYGRSCLPTLTSSRAARKRKPLELWALPVVLFGSLAHSLTGPPARPPARSAPVWLPVGGVAAPGQRLNCLKFDSTSAGRVASP